jgi:hypothetical protein
MTICGVEKVIDLLRIHGWALIHKIGRPLSRIVVPLVFLQNIEQMSQKCKKDANSLKKLNNFNEAKFIQPT